MDYQHFLVVSRSGAHATWPCRTTTDAFNRSKRQILKKVAIIHRRMVIVCYQLRIFQGAPAPVPRWPSLAACQMKAVLAKPPAPGTTARRGLRILSADALHYLALAALLLATSTAHSFEEFAGKVSYVSDGDTLWVQPDAGGAPRKLRIDGIDAPEICQTGGEASREALVQRAMHQVVWVTVRREDDYGRGLARLRIDGKDIGAAMVREGQAWSYRWRHSPGPYAADEALARQERRGLFAVSAPETPRDFRKRHGSCHFPKP
jgi:micrococcal nuclease